MQIIQRVKNFKQIVPLLRKSRSAAVALVRFVTRRPDLILHNSKQTLAKALALNNNSSVLHDQLSKIEDGLIQDLFLYKDVLYFPLGAGITTNHSGGLIDIKTKQLVEKAIHYNGEFVQELPNDDLDLLKINELSQVQHVVMYGGIMFYNFGHFLLESLGRLWAYDLIKDLDPFILFHLNWKEPDYLSRKNFVYMVLEGFKIPHKKILFIDTPALIRNVIVPVQKYGYEYCRHPDETFLKFARGFSFPDSLPVAFVNAEKVYVSRSRVSSKSGRVVGEPIFEKYLSSNGYTIFYPEQYNLYQQLSVYSMAKKIIFCDGGALHGCILLPDLKAEVSVIARRKDARWNCEEITDQFKGYGKRVVWIDGVTSQYQYGMESWNAISVIDWYGVSKKLKENNFVDEEMRQFDEDGYHQLVRSELSGFIGSIQHQSGFLDFMERLKEEVG